MDKSAPTNGSDAYQKGTNSFAIKVNMWEAAEKLYAYDSIMETNISGFCPENDRHDSGLYDEDEFDCDEW